MALMNGRIGQVVGPFGNSDLLADGGAIDVFTPEAYKPQLIKLGIQTNPGTIVKINDSNIRVGKTGIYELDNIVTIKSLSFPEGADENTIVDFVY